MCFAAFDSCPCAIVGYTIFENEKSSYTIRKNQIENQHRNLSLENKNRKENAKKNCICSGYLKF
jgi:hypothetical protein